jgi:hypothetical protein
MSEQAQEMLVWKKETWGSYGQHSNVYTFVIDLETLETKPIFQFITVRHENQDSRKNIHRYAYASVSEIMKLQGKVLKVVNDYASSSKRTINVKYYLVSDGLKELNFETGLKDGNGFFDKVYLNDKILVVRKDKAEIISK